MNRIIKFPRLCTRLSLAKYSCMSTCSIKPKMVQNPLLTPKVNTAISNRTFWETFPAFNRNLFEKDGLDRETHHLVFHSRLYNYSFYAQLISMGTMATQAVMSCYFVFKNSVLHEAVQLPKYFGPFVLEYNWMSSVIFMLFTLQNVMIFSLARNAILRIYHKEDVDKYIIVTPALNPFAQTYTDCKPGEMVFNGRKDLWALLGNYELKGIKFFINSDRFDCGHHLNRMVGWS